MYSYNFGKIKLHVFFKANGWKADLFYILLNSISVISGGWEGDNENLYAMESWLK